MCTCLINQYIKAKHGNPFFFFRDLFNTSINQLYIYFEEPGFRTLHTYNEECLHLNVLF